jgi:formylglycine-generating enzyme required for sulfatase activity
MTSKMINSNRNISMRILQFLIMPALLCGGMATAADKPQKELSLDCGKGQTLTLTMIPSGEFQMGSPAILKGKFFSGFHGGARPVEEPQHKVQITKPFYMGVYTVTQAQYEALMGTNPSRYRGPKRPVEMVSWDEAVEFCKKLSEKTGRQIRLPTEAEWEYACRAGTTTPFYTGEILSPKQANFQDILSWAESEVYHSTVPVGSYPPNPWGLYDMAGNVSQWCQDWYDPKYYKGSPVEDPSGPASGPWRVARGGGWDSEPGRCRSASRKEYLDPAAARSWTKGFRVVCVCMPEEIKDAPKAPEPIPASQLSVWVDTDFAQSHGLTYNEEETFGDLKAQYDFIAELPRKAWKFRTDPKQEGEAAEWFKVGLDTTGWGEMEIGRFWDDFFAEEEKSQSKSTNGDENLARKCTGYAWYRLVWDVPAAQAPENAKLCLWFGAVDEEVVVWVNGVKVGSHEGSRGVLATHILETPLAQGWYERFPIDVTGALKLGKTNTIVVRVHNAEGAGGIWKPVKLAMAKADAMKQPPPLVHPPRAEQPRKELTLDCGNGQSLKMAAIPAGEFLMGTAEDFLVGGYIRHVGNGSKPSRVNEKGDEKYPVSVDEKPQHKVRITKPFYMGIYPVTQEQYVSVMGPHKTYHKGVNFPVHMVTWYDAAEFCKRLSEKTGRQVRLPTEAEWEYAARAGDTNAWWFYPGVHDGTKHSVENYKYEMAPVGSHLPNPWGLYDMKGAVWQWCQDWYGMYYYRKSSVDDPTGETISGKKVLRGDTYEHWWGEFRYGMRFESNSPIFNGYNIGFRVACVCTPEEIKEFSKGAGAASK